MHLHTSNTSLLPNTSNKRPVQWCGGSLETVRLSDKDTQDPTYKKSWKRHNSRAGDQSNQDRGYDYQGITWGSSSGWWNFCILSVAGFTQNTCSTIIELYTRKTTSFSKKALIYTAVILGVTSLYQGLVSTFALGSFTLFFLFLFIEV